MTGFDFSLTRQMAKPYIRVAFDLETFLIAPCVQAPPPVAMGFKVNGGKTHIVMANDPSFRSVVECLFLDDRIQLFAHSAKFDCAVLMAYGAMIGKSVEWARMILGALHVDRVTCTNVREILYHIALAKYDMDEGFKTNLGACAERWNTPTRPNKEDPWRQKWGTLANLHVRDLPHDARKYLVEDVDALDEVYCAQETKAPWLLDQYRQTRSSVSLYLKQCWGFRSDPVQAKALYDKTAKELAEATELCKNTYVTYTKTKTRSVKKQKVTFEVEETKPVRNPDGSANKKAAEAYMVQWCAKNGVPVPRGDITEKMEDKGLVEGNVKLNDEACRATKDPVLIAYAESGQAAGLLGKVKRWSMPVLQPSYEGPKATGRTSVKQGSDPKPGEAPKAYGVQVQNPPKAVMGECPACRGGGCKECKFEGEVEVPGVREIMVARECCVILDIDFTGLEQCMLAQMEYWFFGHSALGEIIKDEKRSALVETGARIMKLSVEEGYALKKKEPKAFKEMRNMAKGPEYGSPGGMAWKRGIDYCWQNYGVRVSEELAKEIFGWRGKDETGRFVEVDGVIKTIYPERKPYLNIMQTGICPANRVGAKVSRGSRGFRVTHPYSLRVRGGVGYTDGNNGWFQGLGSDCARESDWRVTVECYAVPESPLFGWRALAFVHDQNLLEGPEANYRAAAKRLEELWVGGAQDICTDVVIRAKPAAVRRWSKAGGDAVYWEDGSLAIYEDFLLAQEAKKKT
jgi:hypothetical protein